nr:GNAT family N-acetyltransferase [uncultured Fluviicola sp.]
METIRTRKIGVEDLEKLQKIGKQTFEEAFSEFNSEENMKTYLETGFSKEKLSAELEDNNSEFYFALLEDEVIGYLKVNFGESQTELKDLNALEIERIYVSKAFLGKGVGQILYDRAIERAKQKNATYIWLGVWEENPRAISFYRKNGFVAFDQHLFKLGDDEQTDILMKLELDKAVTNNKNQ